MSNILIWTGLVAALLGAGGAPRDALEVLRAGGMTSARVEGLSATGAAYRLTSGSTRVRAVFGSEARTAAEAGGLRFASLS
ncbi:hypothetical protein, partial [Deinococcus pimensis]|uniref:hypothetical protein n=1 Tax=Deinococcus pimensis TaxID=309888 RepID=UPI0005EAF1E7